MVLALVAGFVGIINPDIYDGLVQDDILAGVFTQDLIGVILSLVGLLLIIRMEDDDHISQIIVLGIVGFLFYAYGIYIIEQVYNYMYFVYMAIFGLSFHAMIYSVANINKEILPSIEVPKNIRIASASYMIINGVMFYIIWTAMLVPLLQSGDRIENLFSIFIIDLCFIMPVFFIISYRILKDDGFGLALTPSLFILGFGILFPLPIAEIIKPIMYDGSTDLFGLILYLVLSIIFLLLSYLYIKSMKIKNSSE